MTVELCVGLLGIFPANFCILKNLDYTSYSIYTKKNKMPKLLHTIAKRVRKFRKDRKSNRNAFLIFAAVVMVWSGIANLLDECFFPNKPFIGNLICIVLWLVILLLDDWKLWELEWELELKEKAKN